MKPFDRDSALVHYGALMFGFLTWRILITRGAAISVGSAVIVFCVIEAAVWLLMRGATRRSEQLKRMIDAVNAVPLDEAKARVASLLASHKSDLRKPVPSELSASQKEFFALYNGVRFGDGTEIKVAPVLQTSTLMPGFLVLGMSFDGVEIATRLGDDRVWEIDGPLERAEVEQESYPSIWHYVLNNRNAIDV